MAVAVALGLVLSSCGSDDGTSAEAAADAITSGGDGFEAVSIENCGEMVTFDAPPERAVPVDQNVAEMLLALGVEDDIAAYARQHFNPVQPVLPEFQAEYDALDRLADKSPSRELFLQAEPDFALAAFSFPDDSGLSREQLTDDGIPTYLLPDQCPDRTEPATFEDLYSSMRDLGAIFGVPARAEALIEEWEGTLADVAEQVEGKEAPTVFIYDSGEDAPFTVGGTGPGNAIIEAAGGENIYGREQKAFLDGSWETVLERNPDVIVIMEYFHGDDGENSDTKMSTVQDRLGSTTAVQEGRVVTLDLTGFFLSIRNADTVATLADVLHP